jgi:hypothetical protein
MPKGFAVGGTVNACTKGIWIWGQPQKLEDGTTLLFLDTEGLGSTDRGQTHDARIFSLALLLCSSFIYNSRGVIDGHAIEELSLVINLTKHIQTSTNVAGGGGEESGESFHEFFPSLTWVVRDFTLQLEDNGRKITPTQVCGTSTCSIRNFSFNFDRRSREKSLETPTQFATQSAPRLALVRRLAACACPLPGIAGAHMPACSSRHSPLVPALPAAHRMRTARSISRARCSRRGGSARTPRARTTCACCCRWGAL